MIRSYSSSSPRSSASMASWWRNLRARASLESLASLKKDSPSRGH